MGDDSNEAYWQRHPEEAKEQDWLDKMFSKWDGRSSTPQSSVQKPTKRLKKHSTQLFLISVCTFYYSGTIFVEQKKNVNVS